MHECGSEARALDERLRAAVRQVSAKRMAATVASLSGATFAGRRVGSPGGAAARAWLGHRLEDAGAAVSFDPFAVRYVPDVYAPPDVRWHDGGAERRLRPGREFAVHLASAERPRPLRGGLAVAGEGDPAGRWLVVPAGMTLFAAYGHAYGAAGLLMRRGVDADGWHPAMRSGPGPGPLPILTLDAATHADVQRAARAGAGWLSGTAPIHRLDVAAANVHGRWSGPAGPELLLTAHYDGAGDRPGPRRPAAGDNAGGVAVVIEAARVLAAALPARVRLGVALLDGEQAGALGSAHHAARLRAQGRTPLVINVDGADRPPGSAAVEAGGRAHGLLAAIDQAGRHTGVPLVAEPVASGNRRYAAAGIAAVGIAAGTGGHHRGADPLTAVARLVVAAALALRIGED